MNRFDIPKLVSWQGVGIELGTANGQFANECVKTGRFSRFYTVDEYDDKYFRRYEEAVRKLGTRATVIRARFDEVVSWFPDSHFDFIYIDGFAETGNENGQTFYDWWPKLKSGGLFAIDDYATAWPKNKEAIDKFRDVMGIQFSVVPAIPNAKSWFNRHPSVYMRKP